MEKDDDPYEIIGVQYDTSEDDIKKAYRKLALKYHPDRQQTEEDREKAHDLFSKISAAYDVLTDPVKRYDWKQANEDKINGTSSHKKTSKQPQQQQPPQQQQQGFRRANSYDPRPNKGSASAHTRQGPKRTNKAHPTQGPRARSTSPKPPEQRRPAPPFKRQSAQPGGTCRRPQASSDDSVKSGRSRGSTNSQARNPRAAPNSNTTYTATPGTKEYFVSPAMRPKPKVSIPTSTAYAGKPIGSKARENPRAPNTTYESAGTGRREDPHKVETSYSMSGANGKNIERPFSPNGSPRRVVRPQSAGVGRSRPRMAKPGIAPIPDLNSTEHSERRTKRGSSTGPLQRKARPPGPPPERVRGKSHSPRPGVRKSAPAPESAQERKTRSAAPKGRLHNPFETFERLMKQEFPEDYWERDWKKDGGGIFGSSKNKTLQARTKAFDPNNPATIVSMTVSTKKEKRSDNKKMWDVKTITKIWRLNGTVDKVVQASVVDKDLAKMVEAGTITLTREKAIKQHQQKLKERR